MEIIGINTTVSFLEAQGLAKCFQAYADNCSGNHICEIGFNPNSGYTYIALEDYGISICSNLGQDAVYLVTDFDSGEEHFYETYKEAISKAEELNN